jgi:Lon protease-like protein
VLVGIARARLVKELPHVHGYREIEAELVEDEVVEPEADESLRRAVVELVARIPQAVGQRVAQVTSRVSGGQLADVVASTFMQEPAQRFEVLRETDVRARIEIVTEELLNLVGAIKPQKPGGLLN